MPSKLHVQMRRLRDYAKFHDMNEAVAHIDHEFPSKSVIVELPPMPNPPDPPRAA